MDYPELAQAEIEALTRSKSTRYENLVLAKKTALKTLERLALTRTVYDVIKITTKSKLNNDINKIPWKKFIKKDYKVRSNKKHLEQKLGSMIWKNLSHPKVNLKNPSTILFFSFHKNKIIILKEIKKLKHTFEQRKSHKTPVLRPIAMHPKLARTMVNLLHPAKTITDPFCGTGTILVEAALMKLHPIGYDIDPQMISLSKKNLKHQKLKAKLKQADATKIKAKSIATELPFARNTKKQDLIQLYTNFLKNAEKNKAKIVASFQPP